MSDSEFEELDIMQIVSIPETRELTLVIKTDSGSELILTSLDSAISKANTDVLNRPVYVLSLMPEFFNLSLFDARISHEWLKVDEEDIGSNFTILSKGVKLISKSLETPNSLVIVHCDLGVSFSAALIFAYLVGEQDFDYEAAIDYLNDIRPVIYFNPDMEELLDNWTSAQEWFNLTRKMRKLSVVRTINNGAELVLTGVEGAIKHANANSDKRSVFVISLLSDWEDLEGLNIKKLRNHKFCKLDDDEESNIDEYFSDCVSFIRSGLAIDNALVIVHCFAGISRSSTIVLSYLMSEHNMSLDGAYRYLKSKRSIVCPNSGFWSKLEQLESNLTESDPEDQNLSCE